MATFLGYIEKNLPNLCQTLDKTSLNRFKRNSQFITVFHHYSVRRYKFEIGEDHSGDTPLHIGSGLFEFYSVKLRKNSVTRRIFETILLESN